MTLSAQAFQAAKRFIENHARPLDQARLRFHLQGGPVDDVWDALTAFQNEDGGFGHGIEPDVQTPASSVLGTSIALQILRETKAPMSHPIVKDTVRYLVTQYDAERKCWPMLAPESQDAPHAPWWEGYEQLPQRFGDFLINPRVEILGYLLDYGLLVPPAILEQVVPEVSAGVRDWPESLEMHDLLCYVRLAGTKQLPHNIQVELLPKLQKSIEDKVGHSPEEWVKYSLKPTMVVRSPDSPFVESVAPWLESNFAFEVEQQHEDGSWKPSWSWGDFYPETWPKAQQAWAGKLTVEQLILFHNFGKLEQPA
ncbi:MAG: hypothetical protein EP343_17500 [Deltaproteobacteria bacterium]|nr:MAG: hypothetical protein EP343_17500 [Deltaproteobacteria bacterium]